MGKTNLNVVFKLCLCMVLITQTLYAQNTEAGKMYNMTSTKEKGTRAPQENFTGVVWVNMLVAPSDNLNSVVGQVTFEPTSRTNWHRHSTGQILIVTAGIGYYQEKGNPIQIIRQGDVVKVSKDADHWHGASHTSSMTHIAIVPDAEQSRTEWLLPVTGEEYNKEK